MKTWIKRVARVLAVIAVALVAALAFSPAAYAAKKGWTYESGSYYYYEDDGITRRRNDWASYKGSWYYLGNDGTVTTNDWVPYAQELYYVGKDGKVVTNNWIYSGGDYYYIGKNGLPLTSTWIKYGKSYFYLNYEGKVVVNDWVWYNGDNYYCGADGKPLVNTTVVIYGQVNHFNAYGINDMWYWEDEDLVEEGYWWYNGNHYFYVPELNIRSTYADQVTEYLQEFRYFAEEQVEYIESGQETGVQWIDYYYDVYGDNLSIEIIVHYSMNNWTQEYVFNINLTDGKQTTAAHMLELAHVNSGTYGTWLYNTVKGFWTSSFGDPATMPDFFKEQYNKTIGYDNLASSLLYVSNDGSLDVCVKIYQLAGPEYTYQWFDVNP